MVVLDSPAKYPDWSGIYFDRAGLMLFTNLVEAGGSYALVLRPSKSSPTFSLLPRDPQMHDLAIDLFGGA
jgi:hypothetical protein